MSQQSLFGQNPVRVKPRRDRLTTLRMLVTVKAAPQIALHYGAVPRPLPRCRWPRTALGRGPARGRCLADHLAGDNDAGGSPHAQVRVTGDSVPRSQRCCWSRVGRSREPVYCFGPMHLELVEHHVRQADSVRSTHRQAGIGRRGHFGDVGWRNVTSGWVIGCVGRCSGWSQAWLVCLC